MSNDENARGIPSAHPTEDRGRDGDDISPKTSTATIFNMFRQGRRSFRHNPYNNDSPNGGDDAA